MGGDRILIPLEVIQEDFHVSAPTTNQPMPHGKGTTQVPDPVRKKKKKKKKKKK